MLGVGVRVWLSGLIWNTWERSDSCMGVMDKMLKDGSSLSSENLGF